MTESGSDFTQSGWELHSIVHLQGLLRIGGGVSGGGLGPDTSGGGTRLSASRRFLSFVLLFVAFFFRVDFIC